MRNLMKFGIVLVVLAMVTSPAFASNDFEDDDGGSWCDEDNWDNGEVPECGDGETVRLDDDAYAVIDCTPASADKVEINGDAILQVGVVGGVHVQFDVCGELQMSDDGSSDDTTLDIVNGDMFVKKQCKDLAEDGDITIKIAAGSSLWFDDGIYLGDSNDGTNSTYDFEIAGDFTVEDDRLEHRGGHLIIDLTGDGTFEVEKTSRLSRDDDSQVTVNINTGVGDTGSAVCKFDKIELGNKDDGVKSPYTYSLAIYIAGNGTWDGSGEEIKDDGDNGDGQIFKLDVTGNGTFITKDLNINEDDGEINITMDSGLIDIEDDIDMNAGDIVITGGVFNVEDDFELGDDGVATITVSGTAEVWIDDLYMGDDSELTINGVRMDIDDLKDANGSIEINVGGELVIKNADDQDDWDELNDLVADGKITTSSPGMVIVTDYNVSHDGRFTIQPAIPVNIDIKPGASPNPLRVNVQGSGVFPVAIVGVFEGFEVSTIDGDTVTLDGVDVSRTKLGDVNQDGTLDLVLKFSRSDLLDDLADTHGDLIDLNNREELTLILFARTLDGTLVSGTDTLVILNRGGIKTKKK